MGRRGPKAASKEVLELRGSWRAAGRSKEPSYRLELPPAPEWLSRRAKIWFNDRAKQLLEAGVMCRIFADPLAVLARDFDEWLTADARLRKTGLITKNTKGLDAMHPLVRIRNAAHKRYIEGCKEFGLTPMSKPRISISGKPSGEGKRVSSLEAFNETKSS